MRCACYVCGTYMVHSEGMELGCICPDCSARCKACLGTNTVMSREALLRLKDDPAAAATLFKPVEPFDDKYNPDEYGRE